MMLPQFNYFAPETLEEAFSLLEEFGEEARVLAGGTDLLVKMKQRAIEPLPKYLINIKGIPGLQYISANDDGGLKIGSVTNIQEIKSFLPIRQRFPGLAHAAGLLSTPQVRNIATIGGNLCNASPAAETAPPLITLSAKARILGGSGERTVPIEEFFLGPGKTILEKGEILVGIEIPPPPENSTSVYVKHGKRLSDIAIVGVALVLEMDGNRCTGVKIALASVGPTPLRARKAEAAMLGQEVNEQLIEEVSRIASEESKPIDDIRAHAAYRREKVAEVTKEAVQQALQQIRLGGIVW